MTRATKPQTSLAAVAVLFLGLGGLFSLVAAWRNHAKGDERAASIATAVAMACAAGAAVARRISNREVADEAEAARLRAEHPDEPWKWRREWNAGLIRARTGSEAGLAWFYFLIVTALSVPATTAVPREWARGNRFVALVLVFDLVALLLLGRAIRRTMQWRKFGRVTFAPASVPGAVGGYLGGVIAAPVHLEPEQDVRLKLRCVRRVTRLNTSKDRRVEETILWETEAAIARERWHAEAAHTEIPVLFYVPEKCEPTSDEDPANRVIWRLEATAAVRGVDFEVMFEVPIFRTGETAPAPAPGDALLENYRVDSPATKMARAGVEYLAAGASGFPTFRFRNPNAVAAGPVLLAIGMVMIWGGAELGRSAAWIVGIFVIPFGVLFVVLGWSTVRSRSEVWIEARDLVVVRRGVFGSRQVRVARDEVADVTAVESMRSGERQFYRLVCLGKAGADPEKAVPGESFAVRKARFQLRQRMKAAGVTRASELGGELVAAVTALPRFEVTLGDFVGDYAAARDVAARLREEIRRK